MGLSAQYYRYVIELQDKFSSQLRNIGTQASGTYSRLQHQQAQLNNSTNQFGNTLKRVFGAYIGIQGVKSLMSMGAELKQTKIQFETLTGSVEAGNKMFAELTRFANATPYMNSEVNKSATTMLAFGINAERVMPALKNIGDIASGNGEKFQYLSLAYSQTQAAGRLMGQDLLQMINAGFNPLQEISRKTGISIGDLKDQMEKGAISAKMVEDAFASATSPGGRFYNMMTRMAQDTPGLWSTITGSFKHGLSVISASAQDSLKPMLQWLVTVSDNFVKWAENIKDSGIVRFFRDYGNAILIVSGSLLSAVAAYKIFIFIQKGAIAIMALYKTIVFTVTAFTRGWAVAQRALNIAMMANPIGLIIAAIAALAGGLFVAWQRSEKFRGTLIGTWNVIKLVASTIKDVLVNSIRDFLAGFGQLAAALKAFLSGNFKEAASLAKQGLGNITLVNPVRNTVKGIKNIGENAREEFDKGFQKGKSLKPKGVNVPGMGNLPGAGAAGAMQTATPTGKNGDFTAATANSITSGGSRPTNVNVTLKNLVERLEVHAANITESATEIEGIMIDTLLRVLNSSAKISTQ